MTAQLVEAIAQQHKISQLRAAVLIHDLLTDIKNTAQERAAKERRYCYLTTNRSE